MRVFKKTICVFYCEIKKNNNLGNIILTVADCLTDDDITTGFIDIFLKVYAKVALKQLIMKNNEKINLICANASFRTAELLWLCKSIEMSTIPWNIKSNRYEI